MSVILKNWTSAPSTLLRVMTRPEVVCWLMFVAAFVTDGVSATVNLATASAAVDYDPGDVAVDELVRVVEQTGTVYLVQGGTAAAIAPGSDVSAEDRVVTVAGSKVVIRFDDGSPASPSGPRRSRM